MEGFWIFLIAMVLAGVIKEGMRSQRHQGGRYQDLQARIDELEREVQHLRSLEDRIEVLEDIATTEDVDLQRRLRDLQEEKEMLRRLRD